MKQQSLQKSKIKFLLLEGIHESALDALGRAGYDNVVTYSKSLSTEELRKEIKDAKVVILTCPFEPPKPKTKHGIEIKNAEDYEKLIKNYRVLTAYTLSAKLLTGKR